MWKRFNRPAEKAIGSPTLMETTLDEKSAHDLRSLTNGDFSISSRPAFGRKQTEDVVKALPDLPLYDYGCFLISTMLTGDSLPTAQMHLTENQSYTAVSSIYSQQLRNARHKQPRLEIPRTSSVYPEDVSPPDSPRTTDGARSKKSSPNISPITEYGNASRNINSLSNPSMSGITSPRMRQPSDGTSAFISGWRENVGRENSSAADVRITRWDDFSGEPTDGTSGKPAQATPGATPFEPLRISGNHANDLGNSVEISGGARAPKPLFHPKIRTVGRKNLGKKDSGLMPESREEGKGVTGRSTVSASWLDRPFPAGKKASSPPRKESSSALMGLQAEDPARRSSAPADKVSNRATRKPSALHTLPAVDASITPIAPLKVVKTNPHSPITRAPPPIANADLDLRSPLARNPNHEEIRHLNKIGPSHSPLKSSPTFQPPSSPPGVSLAEPLEPAEFTEADLRAATANMVLSNQPVSRFSATTYNTTIPDSPPATPDGSSPPPPLPTPPPPPLPTSVLHRKHPVPHTTNLAGPAKAPTRKPIPAERPSAAAADKSLPQSPPEAESVDRVAQLEAQLEVLKRRKGNLQIVLHELTHVVQPSSIAYDLASRQEIKKTVEGLHTEEAAVAKEIYETGMKLHRAMKRRDANGMFEPTGLWVRRVTTE